MPESPIQRRVSTTALIGVTTELLQEEGDTSGLTLVTKIPKPVHSRGSCSRLAFTSGDQPLNTLEVEMLKRAEQRLCGNKPYLRGHSAQIVDAPDVVGRFNRNAHPDIRRPSQTWCKTREALRTFRQHLERVLWALYHDVEDLPDVRLGNIGVEQIRHRVHKHRARSTPSSRQIQQLWAQRHLKAIRERLREAQREAFCVTAIATRRDLIAAD